MSALIVNQPFGIGDIIYCQTAVREVAKINGYDKIKWLALPQFVDQCRRAYPDIEWLNCQEQLFDLNVQYEYDYKGDRVLPLRFNVEIMKVPYSQCMASKYSMFGMDYRDWKQDAKWLRDGLKELELYRLLKPPAKYNLINTTYRSDFGRTVPIKPDNDLPCVVMTNIPGYSMFDWEQVIRNATEIHTVSTGLFYMLELLNLKQPIHLYPRKPEEKDFKNIDYLFTKPYIQHE